MDPFAKAIAPTSLMGKVISGAPTVTGGGTTGSGIGSYSQPISLINDQPLQPLTKATPGITDVQGASVEMARLDPYAQYGGVDSYNTLVDQLKAGINNVKLSAPTAFSNLKGSLQSGAEGLVNSTRQGQESINRNRENTQLNKQRATGDLISYVRDGMKSGGTRLANMNSLDSSATEAIARAYSEYGNRQNATINNQAFLQNRDTDLVQSNLNIQKNKGMQDLERFKMSEVNRIGETIRQQLQALDEQAAGLSLPDRIAVEQEKQALIDAGLAELATVDAFITNEMKSINPLTQEQVLTNANNLASAGAPQSDLFQVAPPDPNMQFAAPQVDQLPLYISRRNRQA